MSAERRTVSELVGMGFPEARAREAVSSVGDKSDVQLAITWLLDHGEEDRGGCVEFKHCSHVDELGPGRLVGRALLKFGAPCSHGCSGSENWVCLRCGETRCGRYANRHALRHWEETKVQEERSTSALQAAELQTLPRGHCLALSLLDLSVWCYECQSYVQHEDLEPLVSQMRRLKFGGPSAGEEAMPPAGSPLPGTPSAAHGRLGQASWPLPKLARACADEARPGYQTMRAHEYLDEPEVLRGKVGLLADLIRRSRSCVAYTGAGISTASGIRDYASKAADSVAAGGRRRVSPWEARPTFAHFALVALHREGKLKHWVQQNHDGLPQKAGFPQRDLNEIHGAWYDPSNPVVPMSGTLRTDLIERMLEWEERVDLCLALGTSMVGMNADRMAVAPAKRQEAGAEGALGTVIVALQQTQYDHLAALRIFASIDQVFELLAEEMQLSVPVDAPAESPVAGLAPIVLEHLPYGQDGRRDESASMTMDLRPGQRLRVVNQQSWDEKQYNCVCEVVRASEVHAREGHVALRFTPRQGDGEPVVRILGRWWLEAARVGAVEALPVVPCKE